MRIDMDKAQAMDPSGSFEARYRAFLETITHLRPSLKRYCSRMTGSVLDGEDSVHMRQRPKTSRPCRGFEFSRCASGIGLDKGGGYRMPGYLIPRFI